MNHLLDPRNNYSSQGSYGSHNQSAATNNLNIDPALLALGGNQHTPSNINFLAGSRPTFQYMQQNALQGSHTQQLQGSPPPSPNKEEKKATADAYYMDTLKEFTHFDSDGSDSSPGKPVYDPAMPTSGVQPHPMTSKGAFDAHFDAQPFSPTNAIAGSKGANNFIAFPSQHSEIPTASSQAPIAVKKDSNDYQSTGIANKAHESMWPPGDARQDIQQVRKRGRSARDSSGSIDKDVEILRKAQGLEPQPQPNPAKRLRTLASKTSIEDQDTMQSSTAQPVLQAPNPQLAATAKVGRRESLVAADYSGVKIASDESRNMSRKQAHDIYVRRVPLELKTVDNVEEVKAERQKWIRAIRDTFDAPYNDEPEMKKLLGEKLLEFQRWQKEHYVITLEYLNKHIEHDRAEAAATVVYYEVVDAHEKGSLVESSGTTFEHEVKMTCKDRMENVISVLKALTIIRKDLVFGYRLTELVAGPGFVLKRKEENKQENDKKKKKKQEDQDMESADKETSDDTKKANRKAKNDQAKADKKATNAKKQGAKSNTAVVDSDARSTSVSSENLKAAGTRASSDADRSASFDRNDSISVPDAMSVDDGGSGADQRSPEDGEESSADS
jgi:hypothetical protein